VIRHLLRFTAAALHCSGVSFNQYFNDFSNYTNAWLHQLLEAGEAAHPGLAISVKSWRRQRQYIDWALEVRRERETLF
jgi:hypothetical protein